MELPLVIYSWEATLTHTQNGGSKVGISINPIPESPEPTSPKTRALA